MRQYMPLKPVKRGIKVWECADSSNGYVCNLSVYTGKERDADPQQGLGYRVVHNLTRPLVGKNHHVFVDNFFSSIPLAENLLQDKIYVCGTVCANRQGIPREGAPKTQGGVKRLRQGESLFLRKGNVVVTVWKDKKPVYFLSTQSNPVGDDRVNRRQRDGSIVEVPSVPVVKSYNSMGGVDLSDQLHGYYMTGRKSKKWWRSLFWFLVDISIVNAHILEKLLRNHRNRTQLAFRLELVSDLISNFPRENCPLVLHGLKEDTGL